MLDTMTVTKVVGAFCGALLVYLMGGWLGESLYHVGHGHGGGEQAYLIDVGDDGAGGEEEAPVDFLTLVSEADAGSGERIFRQCGACHKIDEPANGVGPHLDNVMGRDIASIGDYGYSGSLPSGEAWTIDNMNKWITNPSEFAPGTTMSYRGIADDEDRANLVAYLISKSPEFVMPEPSAEDAAAPAEDAAPAEEAAPEEETAPAE